MGEYRRPLSIFEIRDRLEARVFARKEVRVTWETGFELLRALRAYLSHPKRDEIAAIICVTHGLRREPCKPPCRQCLRTAGEIRARYRGEPEI